MLSNRFLSLALFLALLASFLSPPAANAQITIGPGVGFAAFLGENGRLSNIEGLSASVKLEIPLNEHATGAKDAAGKAITDFTKSLYLGVPVIADQNTLLTSFDAQLAAQLGKSDVWGLVGFEMSFASASLLKRLDTREVVPEGDEIQTAIFFGPKIGFYGEVPLDDDHSFPVEVQASLDWHVAGIPDELEHPEILRFDVIVPHDLLK